MADLRPKYPQFAAALHDGGMAHVGIEQRRARLEIMQAVLRAVKQAGHRQRVRHPTMLENAHVAAPENLRLCLEIDTVPRYRSACGLRPHVLESVIVHDDLAA